MQTHQSPIIPDDEPFSFRTQIGKLWSTVTYVLIYWRLLIVAAVFGALIGLGYAWWKPTTYTAGMSFVVEESKAGGGSIMSALAGQLGFDIGGLSGTSGVLAGDNVLQLLKSTSLIRKTLLTPYDSSKESLADVYAEVYGWKKKWEKDSDVGIKVSFPAGKENYPRLEDSLLQRIIKQITEDELSISKPDKKLGFFELQTTMRDEKLSLLFCQRLLKTATDFYIETKTRRLATNVKRLQDKADSLENSLNRKTYSTADASRMLLDANPVYKNPEVTTEISTREKYMQATIYSEIVKNLEMSKTALIQETPTVQVVDEPTIPLKKNHLKFLIAALAGAGIVAFATGLVISAGKKEEFEKMKI